MKTKITVITVSIIMLGAIFFTTCEQPSYDPKSFFNNEALEPSTLLQFDNIDIFPVTIYSDPAMSIKLVDVAASGSVTVDTDPAPDGMAFYPRYHLSVEGIAIPPYDGDAIVARVDEQQTTVVPIPPLESIDSADAFIKLENASYFSLVMKKGTTEIRPSGENSAIVMSGETVGYSIPPGASSQYCVYKNGTTPLSFPAGLTEFNAGYVYSLRYDGTALVQSGAAKPIFPLRHTVRYDANEGNGQVPLPQVVIQGSGSNTAADQGDLSRAGYTFGGWNTKADGSGTAYSVGALLTVSANTTLYARWLPITYTVTYHANGAGGSLPSPQSAPFGSSVTISGQGVLTLSNKVFDGWNTASNGGGTAYPAGSSVTVSENLTLYAQWADPATIRYTVTYNANGAGGTAPTAQTVSGGTLITVSNQGALSYSGKGFKGWNTAANGAGTAYTAGASITVTANVTLFAQWINVYTVSYSANGGSGTAPASQTANAGTSIKVASQGSISYSGRTFAGWNTAAGGTGTAYAAGASLTVNGDVTLFAKWTVKVTYNANGGSGTAPTAQTVSAGSGVTVAGVGSLSRSGYAFGGWNTSSSGLGTTYAAGASLTVSANVTLYAVWTTTPVPDGLSLAASLTWLTNNAADGGAYTITVKANEIIAPPTLSYGSKSVSVTLKGDTSMRTITLSRNNTGSISTVSSKVTLTLDNNVTVILQGWMVNDGKLIMNNGATIIGYQSIGVSVSGSFTMNGGEIIGGRVQNASGGTFTMNNGKISGSSTVSSGTNNGAGVSVNSGVFIMTGGEISGNVAGAGGGVSVTTGKFTKTGGIIYGSDATDTLRNTAYLGDSYGHAVYVFGSPEKKRNTTAGAGVNLDSSKAGAAGGWE